MILEHVDLLCIAESKLDSSFSEAQFRVQGFKQPFRLDVSDKSGGLLLYAREELSVRKLQCPHLHKDIQCIIVELNLRKQKWLLISVYRNPKQQIRFFLEEISKLIDYYSSDYENLICMGDFNEETKHPEMKTFLSSFDLHSLIHKQTCHKSAQGRSIDLILTNKNRSFIKSNSFETGISDHHELIYTMFKTTYMKLKPTVINYRSFKHFSSEMFRGDFSRAVMNLYKGDFVSLCNVLESVLDAHAPKKKRTIRGNQKPHLTKTLRKAIMLRSFYKRRANMTGDSLYLNLYKKQRNLVVNINRKAKENYFRDLGTSPLFWKSTKVYFSKSSSDHENILLRDTNNNTIRDEGKIADIFNSFFVNITDSLNITPWETWQPLIYKDILEQIRVKFQNHPSVIAILTQGIKKNSFSFSDVTNDEIFTIICKLNPNKSVSGAFSSKLIKMVADILSEPLSHCINSSFRSATFPESLKLADVTPIFKKGDKFLKENYRPVSILPCLSKVFERVIFSQLSNYFDSIFHVSLSGFRSKYCTQHAILQMIGQWNQCLDTGGVIGAVLMDLSKAFDCIDHELLLAKLSAYGINPTSLNLIKCYLNNRFQRTKVGSTYSSWKKIRKGVPQGSILGPLLFNIFLNDIFYFVKKTSICNFADDNTLYSCADTCTEVKMNLESDVAVTLDWYTQNLLVANPTKFQMLVLGKVDTPVTIQLGNFVLTSTESVELLGITLDRKLTFSNHVNTLCCRAQFNVLNLTRLRRYLSKGQLVLLLNSYIISTFTYAPIVWMFCSKTSYGEIEKIHKRALRAVLGDYSSDYEVLLQNSSSKRIHDIHLYHLMCEVFKTLHNLNPSFMQVFFSPKATGYSLRNSNLLTLPEAKSQSYGFQTFHFRGSLLWNVLPANFKTESSLYVFKRFLKSINLQKLCTCKICE